VQIGFTSLVENRVASQEKIIRQDYVKRKIVETSARRSRRIEKRVKEERNRKEKTEKRRSSAVNTVIKFIAVLAHFLLRVPESYINAIQNVLYMTWTVQILIRKIPSAFSYIKIILFIVDKVLNDHRSIEIYLVVVKKEEILTKKLISIISLTSMSLHDSLQEILFKKKMGLILLFRVMRKVILVLNLGHHNLQIA